MRETIPLLCWMALACACGDNLTSFPERPTYVGEDADALACTPNLDGRLDASELPMAIGVPVTFLVSAAQRGIDVAGQTTPEGTRVWDWTSEPDDPVVQVTAAAVGDKWYAGSFPDGEVALPFDLDGAIEAVYRLDDTGLKLLGLASAEQDPAVGRTLLIYTDPVTVHPLPLVAGSTWQSTGVIRNGLAQGVPYAGDDIYDGRADGLGRMRLPDLTFTQAHRVRTEVTVAPIVGQPTSVRQVSFLFECFGEVARATSRPDETTDDFTVAAEIRRLGLWP